MKIGKLKIIAERWPWQHGYTWKGSEYTGAPLNRSGARFGSGWKYKLGVDWGGSTVIVNLLFGMLRISWGIK